MTLRLPVGCSTTELQGTRGEIGRILGLYVTRVLYTAGIHLGEIFEHFKELRHGLCILKNLA